MTAELEAWLDTLHRRLALRDSLLVALGDEPAEFAPPLDEAEVAFFEAAHNITLPAAYRAFVTRIGTGGPGPEYGILAPAYTPFSAMPSVTATVTTTDGDSYSATTGDRPTLGPPSRLDRPFLLQRHWCPVDDDGEPQAPPVPEDANVYDGILPIAEIGCGYFVFLIVTGPRRGEVGVDHTAGDGSMGPLEQDFGTWYDEWLDSELRHALDVSIQTAMSAGAWTVDPDILAHMAYFETPLPDPEADLGRLAGLARARWYVGDRGAAHLALEALCAKDGAAARVSQLEALFYTDSFAEADSASDPGRCAALATHPSRDVRLRLARNPHVDGPTLVQLARDPDLKVRRAVATHPHTPPDALTELAGHGAVLAHAGHGVDAPGGMALLDRVARRGDLPDAGRRTLDALAASTAPWASVVARSLTHRADATQARLEEAAFHPAPWVRHAAANHASSPPPLVARLASDPHWAVRMGAAGNPLCPPEILARMAGDGRAPSTEHERVLEAVARNPATPSEALWALGYALGADHSYALCRNPALPEGVMLAMLHLDRANVLGLWERPNLPDSVRAALLSHWSSNIRRESAERAAGKFPPFVGAHGWWSLPPDAPIEEVLVVAAGERHPAWPQALYQEVLAKAVAENRPTDAWSLVMGPWVDLPWLETLAHHAYAATRAAVAVHPDVSEAVLVMLAADPEATVRGAAASNAKTPPEVVGGLVEDEAKEARAGVARNRAARRDWLEQLVRDPDRWVRRDVALNPRADVMLVRQLLQEEPLVLAQVAAAPGLDAEALAELAAHGDIRVREAARWRGAGDAFRAARAGW